jgi:putative ABC transport system substrate-binding protein
MNDRRRIIRTIVAAVVAASVDAPGVRAAASGAAKAKPRIGRISEGGPPAAGLLDTFRKAMRDLGHPAIVIEERNASGQFDKLPELAAELVGLRVDVIWTAGSVATAAAKNATKTIPIVMVSGDAIGAGLVDNLARPGGNLTGLTLIGTELVSKRLELMKQMYPGVKRLAALCSGPNSLTVPIVVSWVRESEAAANTLRLPFTYVELSADPQDWDSAFASLAALPGTALSLIESPYLRLAATRLAALELKHRLPAVYALQEHVRAGSLYSYGVSPRYPFERSAHYIARILDGARPGDLPIEQPTKYELLINLRTAKALGLTIPKSVLLRADEVIR